MNRILLKTHSNLKKIFFYDSFLVFFSQTPFIFSKNMCYDQILVVSVVTHVIFVKNDPKPSKMEVYCTSIQKNWGQTPSQRGGVPWKTVLLLVFWGSLAPPFRGHFHCNTIQNIVFNDQMIIFEWFYNENDPPEGQFSL